MSINFRSIFLFVFICGCNSHPTHNSSEPTYPVKIKLSDCFGSQAPTIQLSNIADTISYLKLETTEECLIGNITTIKNIDSGFLINDNMKSLLLFNKDGKFMWKISKQGRGPLEYEMLNPDFDIDHKLDEILVPDRKQIFIYNYSGQFVKVIKVPFYVNQIYVVDSGSYLIANTNPNENYLAHIINRNGTIIKDFRNKNIQKKANEFGRINNKPYSQIEYYQDRILISNMDTIWQLNTKNELEIKFIVDCQIKNTENKVYTYSFNTLNRASLGLYFMYQKSNALYNFDSNLFYKLPGGPAAGIIDDIDSGPDVSLWKAKDGMLIEGIPASRLLSVDINRIRKESILYEIIKNTNLNDNPILRIIKIKK
jgi:hypothetical protein